MARSAHKLALLLHCAAGIISTVAGDVVNYSIPAFNAATTGNLLLVSNNSTVVGSSFSIFGPGADSKYNSSEGFLLLEPAVNFWRSGTFEASFNTSFTLVPGAAPISFVVLKNIVPNAPVSLDIGPVQTIRNGSHAVVELGAVTSNGPYAPTDGVNVTVTSFAGDGCAVWIEYRAAVHNLSVYVAGAAGEPKPSEALLHAPLNLFAGRNTTETAFVGFVAAMIRDVIDGVRDWDLTVDKFPEQSVANGNKGTSWLVVLLAVLGTVAASTI